MSTTLQSPTPVDQVTVSAFFKLRILVATLLATLLLVNCLSLCLHSRRRVTRQIEQGIHDAMIIHKIKESTQVLFIGNSLIFEGVSKDALQRSMEAGFIVHTTGIPGSTYDDWKYGLRALFERKAHPDVVVAGLSPSQFLRAPAATPLPVSQLWRAQEILAYYRETRPGLTELSELFLEHYSTFFYMRDTYRIYARKVIPGYEDMIDAWTSALPAPHLATSQGPAPRRTFSERLSALEAECRGHAQLVLIIVPTNQTEDAELEPSLQDAAAKLGIAVLAPVGERDWPRSQFQPDGYHLTPAAAVEFSHLAGAQLATMLAIEAHK